ncbi:MAG TPA: V-type ATP synthase subunit E family protein [Candidatus Nanoarchaeia archaeon]|nr:V-type ATP synthase subunit E family protein [Candidatus Nanoarchaeia archaeon]
MGLEEVKRDILEKADSEAKRIISEGKREAEKIGIETEAQIKSYREKAKSDASRLIEAMERKEAAAAEFEAKKMKLDKKKEIINAAFADVRKTLSSMPESRREAYLKRLVEKAKKEIDVAYVYANSSDRKIIERMHGVSYKEADLAGGIIAENQDSSIRVDYSYEEILDSIEKESMQEIAAKLFSS